MKSANGSRCAQRVTAKAVVVERQLVAGHAFWTTVAKCIRGRGGRRQRLFAILLLSAGAYCLVFQQTQLQQQEQQREDPPSQHLRLALSSHGNKSRALTAFGDDPPASHKTAVGLSRADRAVDGPYPSDSTDKERLWDDSSDEEIRWINEVETDLKNRRERVWEVCKENNLVGEDGKSKRKPNAWEFFIDENHHLVWCNIFKAASSSWMYNFNLLGGYKRDFLARSKKSPLILARSLFPRPSVERLNAALPRSLSFLIVRDPFERLLSAYRNKIEGFRHKFYRKMSKEIISKFRNTTRTPRKQWSRIEDKGPTFSEFVSWVIASAKEGEKYEDGGTRGAAGFDEHWAPYFRFCTPCSVNFTVIAKVETLSRDEKYIILKTGIGGVLGMGENAQVSETTKPRDAVNAAVGGRTEDVLPSYFRNLTRAQVEALYNIYKTDFQMYGYDASKYFDMVPP